MIAMLQWPLQNTRTPERSCFYEAECEVDGQRYSARSRHGAPNKLARLLISAGVPDQSVEVRRVGIKGCVSYRSLHELARWTYQETAGAAAYPLSAGAQQKAMPDRQRPV